MSARARKRCLLGFIGCPNRHLKSAPYARWQGRWVYR